MFFPVTIVTIIKPPENTTVCRGSNVNISCGYQSNTTLQIQWNINHTRYEQEDLLNNTLFQLNNLGNPMMVSLAIFSISGNTSLSCIVNSETRDAVGSSFATVTVIGTYVCTVVRLHVLLIHINSTIKRYDYVVHMLVFM